MKRATVQFFHTRDCPHYTGGGWCPEAKGVMCPDGELQAPPDDCPLPDVGQVREGPANVQVEDRGRKNIGYLVTGWCGAARAIVTSIPLENRSPEFREALEDAAGAITRAEDALRDEFVKGETHGG